MDRYMELDLTESLVPSLPSEPGRDDTERRRVGVRSMNGDPYDVTVCEDDCVGSIRKMLRHRTWAHVELLCDGCEDPLNDKELVKNLPLGPLHMVIVPSQLVMACVGKELILWGCQCGTVETLAVFKSAPTALLADVSSQRVLVGCHNGHLELLKINQKWSLDFEHDPGRGWVTAIQAFWKDDLAVVAFHNYDSELVIYDLTKGDCLRRLPQPEEVMPNQMAVGISGGHKICISACLGVGPVISVISESSEVVEPRGRPLSQLSDSGTALDVCFNQKRIVTGTTTGALELWNFSTGQIEHVKAVRPQERQPNIRAIAADWSTERAVTASSNGALRLWDLDHGCMLSQIQGHGKLLSCISANFGEGGGLLCTSGLDRMMKLWRIKTRDSGDIEPIELISQMPQTPKIMPVTGRGIQCNFCSFMDCFRLMRQASQPESNEMLFVGHEVATEAVSIAANLPNETRQPQEPLRPRRQRPPFPGVPVDPASVGLELLPVLNESQLQHVFETRTRATRAAEN